MLYNRVITSSVWEQRVTNLTKCRLLTVAYAKETSAPQP